MVKIFDSTASQVELLHHHQGHGNGGQIHSGRFNPSNLVDAKHAGKIAEIQFGKCGKRPRLTATCPTSPLQRGANLFKDSTSENEAVSFRQRIEPPGEPVMVGSEINTKSDRGKRAISPDQAWPAWFVCSGFFPSRCNRSALGRLGGQVDLYAGDAAASPFL